MCSTAPLDPRPSTLDPQASDAAGPWARVGNLYNEVLPRDHEGVTSPVIDPASTFVQILTAVADTSGTADERLVVLSDLLNEFLRSSTGLMMHGAPSGDEVRVLGRGATPTIRLEMQDELSVDRAPDPLIDRFRNGQMEPTTAGRAYGGQRAWQASPKCIGSIEMWGINQVAALPVRPGVEFVAFLIGRHGDDYDDEDLALLRTVQPMVGGLTKMLEPEHLPPLVRPSAPLTEREHEVLRLLAAGHTAKAIARRAGCSLRTVHRHLSNIYPKLEVSDRLAAVSVAHRLGLLDDEYDDVAQGHG